MALLQPKLSLKVAQRQVLTPGLMQMVSVLALNKLELKEMIDAEMVENPVLEEIDETVPMLDEVAGREERLERGALERWSRGAGRRPRIRFNEIDFGSYFQEYLDPGYRTQPEYEDSEKPSFENFLSQPTTLSDHLAWQLGALTWSRSCTRRRSSSSAIWTRTATWPQRRRAGGGLCAVQTGSAQGNLERQRQRPCAGSLPMRSILCSAPSTWCSISTRPAWQRAICASAC